MGTTKGNGYIYRDKTKGVWIARIGFTDQMGRRRQLKRQATSKPDAVKLLRDLIQESEKTRLEGGAVIADVHTFDALADYYEKQYLVPPVYVDGRKVAGLRSYRDGQMHLHTLRDYFHRMKLDKITYGVIEAFRRDRLAEPVWPKNRKRKDGKTRPRSLASVHRTLSLLRSMLRVAEREGWIQRNPFTAGKPLINSADERKRERVLSADEERRLLSLCTGRRALLRPLLICALDTGMRAGEMFTLRWSDVYLRAGIIILQSTNTKTMRSRSVPISGRLSDELSKLREGLADDAPVFNRGKWVQCAMRRLCREAGVEGFRLHDCRHTFATRLVQAGMPITEVARLLGHTTLAMTYRYTNADGSTLTRAAELLDRLNVAASAISAGTEARPDLVM